MLENANRLLARSRFGLIFLAAAVCLPLHAATINVPAEQPTIVAAITAAAPGDTIQVAAGIYTEQLFINKSLTISGAGSGTTTIQAPGLIVDPVLAERSIVAVFGAVNVTISGFTIQGPGTGCSVAYGMVAYQGATLTSNNNHVTRIGDFPFSGVQCGTAIRAGFPAGGGTIAHLNVNNTQIDSFQKNGIRIDGAGSTATITGSTVTGNDAQPVIAQNGIVVTFGATATITGNTVTGVDCDNPACGPDPVAQTQSGGILLFGAGNVTMSGNTLTGNDTGIQLFDSGGTATSSNDTITGNRYENILVQAGTLSVQGSVVGPPSAYAIYALSAVGDARPSVVQVQCTSSITGPQFANTIAGAPGASITLQGCVAPTISKAFGAPSIGVNGATTLTFTLTNPNLAIALTGVGFTDTLPAGLVVSTPNGLLHTCGGPGSVVAASNSVVLTGGALPAGASCTINVSVTGTTVGTKNNVTGTVSSVEGGTGGTASASLDVVAVAPVVAPSILMTFGASSISVNGTTTMTFTLTNPNATTTLTGVGFSDALPPGLVVTTPNGLVNACSGTVTATAASGSVSLANATLAAAASCNITVNVTATTAGNKVNTTGAVTSVEGGSGGTASATLIVTGGGTIPPSSLTAAIPTLQEWALWLLSLLILVSAGATFRKRRSD